MLGEISKRFLKEIKAGKDLETCTKQIKDGKDSFRKEGTARRDLTRIA